ncbi:hypothetical protein AB0O60_35965 [Streptomyces tanashiensis]
MCRDRAPFFAEGAAARAPQAVQVADRWHLWHNVGEAAERAVAQHRRCLRVLVPAAAEPEPASVLDDYKPSWTSGGRTAAPTPGSCGRSSCRSATAAATSAFAPTCTRSEPQHGR